MEDYRHSVISTVYLYDCFTTELNEADAYFRSVFGESHYLRYASISWIRCSTGRLCVEVAPDSADYALRHLESSTSPHIPLSSLGPGQEMSMICSLTLNDFHTICWCYLSTSKNMMPTLDKIQLSRIVSLNGESIQEFAHISNVTFQDYGWNAIIGTSYDQNVRTDTEGGWSRLHSSCVNGVLQRTILCDTAWGGWLSQANYVFSQLTTPPKHEDFFLIYCVEYQLSFSSPPENLPEGYLFLCPLEDLRDGEGTFLGNPECPAYWSLDPSGIQTLSPEEASSLGFPSLNWKTCVRGCSWDEGIYAALSRFHAAKGFDPNGQDIARHLGQPLYELSSAPNVDSAHSEY
ncbi:hypothetical protein C8R44DRAFT_718197 [Mycena epipterygia]|nr:hypothetical protein C8R44DRAFT_718197 [Mycena epipterygia]